MTLRLNDYQCPECGRVSEILAHEYEEIDCGCSEQEVIMRKLPPMFRINVGPVPTGGYYDENLDTYITSNAHRKKVMREQGVTESGATPKLNEQAWV